MRYLIALFAATGAVSLLIVVLSAVLHPDDRLGVDIEWWATSIDPAVAARSWNCPVQIDLDKPDIPAIFSLHKPKTGPYPRAGVHDLLEVTLYECEDKTCVEGPANLSCTYGHGVQVGPLRVWLGLRPGLAADPVDMPGRSDWDEQTSLSHYIGEDGHYHGRSRTIYTCRSPSRGCLFNVTVTDVPRPVVQW